MIDSILKNSTPTDIENVFEVTAPKVLDKKPWIVFLFGPSGAGKDTLAKDLQEKHILNVVTTATSRKKRPEEKKDVYVWMRAKRDNETEKDYVKNLVKEYELMEHDPHHNAVYGVPRLSVEKALRKGSILLIIEINGVETISRLMKGKANLLKIFVLPESIDQIKKRIKGRGDEAVRFEKALDELRRGPKIANFFLLNKENQITKGQQSLEKLVKRYINN